MARTIHTRWSYSISFSRLRSSSVQCAWSSIIVRNVLISNVHWPVK